MNEGYITLVSLGLALGLSNVAARLIDKHVPRGNWRRTAAWVAVAAALGAVTVFGVGLLLEYAA